MSYTAGSSRKDAIEAGKEILEMAREEAEERGMILPDTTPLQKIDIRTDEEFSVSRVIVEYVEI
ncbi:hypothetical protein [Bacillus massiliglaciei]|uniref:hypothetical protein n=1 Tax=Bacillus massiliglaciei TaxID=1816693 RepID=UPI000DA635FA|nr:hypothetical protein [Bacillus massiliglaciei]